MDLSTRFWSKVKKTPKCWVWTASRKVGRYGQFSVNGDLAKRHGRNAFAHRLAWEFAYGTIPEGALVCHHCDNPACVRPEHLFLGDDKSNAADKTLKGRAAIKINVDIARAIKADIQAKNSSQRSIAAFYGVSQTAVWAIANGRIWTHA